MTNPLDRRDFLKRLLALPAALAALVHPALADEAEAARALYAASTPGRGDQRDGLFDRALLLATGGAGRERVSRFNFVLRG